MRPIATRQPGGFTLLEVMLVLLLMGLIAGTISFTSLSTSKETELKEQAQRFQVVVGMVSDYAVLNQQEIGLRIDTEETQANGYYFVTLDDEQQWQRFEPEKLFRPVELQETFFLQLQLENLPWQQEDSLFDNRLFDESLSVSEENVDIGEEEEALPPPQVLILSSGEITPFSLTFGFEPGFSDDAPVYFQVNAEDMPPLTLSEPLNSL
ncbi:type II secretion system minor pseudopilin GspH [Lacimicrobium sp. SS2-24]|uniref:type II secretion system minor pseudopilin GspH n=1 Tax=Lacimicrobium sp. SS2-24 TaxID=2005569 RepID=UPI000B4A650E|nr:type II secretion system minor pseudopilin GspH [Lacimicrobium sp. SS2-24]